MARLTKDQIKLRLRDAKKELKLNVKDLAKSLGRHPFLDQEEKFETEDYAGYIYIVDTMCEDWDNDEWEEINLGMSYFKKDGNNNIRHHQSQPISEGDQGKLGLHYQMRALDSGILEVKCERTYQKTPQNPVTLYADLIKGIWRKEIT